MNKLGDYVTLRNPERDTAASLDVFYEEFK